MRVLETMNSLTRNQPEPHATGTLRVGPMQLRWPLVRGVVLTVAIALLAPMFLSGADLSLLSTAAIYALFALSTLVLFGWMGLGTFGQAAFFGTGAYAAALIKNQPLDPVLVLLISGAVSTLMALVIGILVRKTSGRQFAILTLALAQVLYQVTFTFRSVLQGDNGIFGIFPHPILGFNLISETHFWWYSMAITGLLALLLYGLKNSQLGRSLNAVRDDPVKAAALGVSVGVSRLAAFVAAGFMAGVAGALFVQQQSGASPTLLSPALSGSVIFMVLIGGMSSMWGPVLGATIYTVLTLRLFQSSSTATIWIGLLLLAVVVGFKGGVVGIARRATHLMRARWVN